MSIETRTHSRRPHEGIVVVELGTLREAERAFELRWQLLDAVTAGAATVVVDMRGVTALSAEMISSLLSAHRVCRIRGGGVELRCCERPVVNLLHRTALWRVFTVRARVTPDDSAST